MTVANGRDDQQARPHLTTDDFAVVMCTSDDSFAARLRSALAALPVGCETLQTAGECLAALEKARAATLVIELDGRRAAEVIELLWLVCRRWPAVRSVVVAHRGAEAYEPLARELGAVEWTVMPHDVRPMVEIIRRRRAELPAPQRNKIDELRARLPWPAAVQDEANQRHFTPRSKGES